MPLLSYSLVEKIQYWLLLKSSLIEVPTKLITLSFGLALLLHAVHITYQLLPQFFVWFMGVLSLMLFSGSVDYLSYYHLYGLLISICVFLFWVKALKYGLIPFGIFLVTYSFWQLLFYVFSSFAWLGMLVILIYLIYVALCTTPIRPISNH